MIEARGLTRTFKGRASQASKAANAGKPGASNAANAGKPGAGNAANAGKPGAGNAANAGTRGAVEAVRGVDLDVAAGEIVGLLGPNGAGKTTMQRMLATLLVPTAGEAKVGGCDLPTPVERGLRVTVDRGETQALPLMRRLDEADVRVSALHVAHPTLDDVFLTLTGRSLRDDA